MPRMKFSGWDKLNTRWIKMYEGKRYRITCKELGLPKSHWTKELSVKFAKKWWLQTLGQLNSQEIIPQINQTANDNNQWIITKPPEGTYGYYNLPKIQCNQQPLKVVSMKLDYGELPDSPTTMTLIIHVNKENVKWC